MARTLIYKTDKGCRKGCHPVNIIRTYRGKKTEEHYFSIDEPGAWWADKWNCHVDGTDRPFNTRRDAIKWGAHVLYDSRFHGGPEITVKYEK